MKKRVVFAAPFVVITACDRPIERRVVEAPRDAATIDAAIEPDKLVDELKPLDRRTRAELDRTTTHNPPRPGQDLRPPEVKPRRLTIVAMQRDGAGARVRFERTDARMDRTWRAVFATPANVEVANGECTIVDGSLFELECTTRLPPEQLAHNGRTYKLWIEPPAELVEKIERERAGPPDPVKPATLRGRITSVRVEGAARVVTAAMGEREGITRTWRARLLDQKGKPLAGGGCTIVRVERNRTTCRVYATTDLIATHVLFEPR